MNCLLLRLEYKLHKGVAYYLCCSLMYLKRSEQCLSHNSCVEFAREIIIKSITKGFNAFGIL